MTTPLIQALSRLADNRQSDGTSSLVSAEDRAAIINGCHDLMMRSRQALADVIKERDDARAALVKVADWINTLPIPTTGATRVLGIVLDAVSAKGADDRCPRYGVAITREPASGFIANCGERVLAQRAEGCPAGLLDEDGNSLAPSPSDAKGGEHG